MAHDPSKCGCNDCKEYGIRVYDDFETSFCKKDNNIIECWGADKCPLK